MKVEGEPVLSVRRNEPSFKRSMRRKRVVRKGIVIIRERLLSLAIPIVLASVDHLLSEHAEILSGCGKRVHASQIHLSTSDHFFLTVNTNISPSSRLTLAIVLALLMTFCP